MVSTLSEYSARKAKILAHLGGKCVKCGSTNDLHTDHIDHNKKNFTIMERWAYSWEILEKELQLCQLLCSSCHKEKSIKEGSLAKGWTSQPQGVKHGKVWSYVKYKCRCPLCVEAKRNARKG